MADQAIPEATAAGVREIIKKTLDNRRWVRLRHERSWYEPLLYYAGRQWIYFDQARRTFQKQDLKSWVPQPVTNRLACLDGDTVIPCLDGTQPTIQALAESGATPWLYGFDVIGMRVVPTKATRVWKTGRRPTVRVEFSEGTAIVCTPDHRFLTWGRSYVEAQDLKPGESIIPWATSKTGRDYPKVLQPADGHMEHIHRFVARECLGMIPAGWHVHHRNGNVWDNRPENLEVLSKSKHASLTWKHLYATREGFGTRSPDHPGRMRRLWADPEYRAKQRASRLKAWENDSERRKHYAEVALSRIDPETGQFVPNHRVSAVVPAGERDVYDISTPDTQNFATGAGVFVHNSAMDTVIAVLLRVQPNLIFRPGTQDGDDIAAADVAGKIMTAIQEQIEMDRLRQEMARWLVGCGNVYVMPFYDPEGGPPVRVPYEVCAQCNTTSDPASIAKAGHTCPTCGGRQFTPSETDAGTAPGGQIGSQVISPFECFPEAMDRTWMAEQSRVVIRRLIPLDLAKEKYPHLADMLQPDQGSDQGLLYQEALAYTTGEGDGIPSDQMYGGIGPERDRIVEKILLHRRTQHGKTPFPEGAYAVAYGEELAELKPLPYQDQGKDIWPLIQFVFSPMPGAFFAKTPIRDLVYKQRQRNVLESHIMLSFARTSNPIYLWPEGIGITQMTGMPGQVVRYNALNPSRAKPERIPGMPPPPILVQYLQRIDSDIEHLSATFDVLQGARPPNISAGYALQILIERGMSRFGPVFLNWEWSHEAWARALMGIFRQFGSTPLYYRVRGRNSLWEIKQFTNADLKGSIDIRVEAGSAAPRSQVAERVLVDQVVQRGWINPQSPEVRRQILKTFGLEHLDQPLEKATTAILREQDRFMAIDWKSPVGVNPEDGTPITRLDQLGQLGQQAQRLSAQAKQLAQATQAAQGAVAPEMPEGADAAAAQAQAMLDQMEELCGLVLRDTDDHPSSIEYHNELARTEEYESKAPRPVQRVFEGHVLRHRGKFGQQAAQMQAMAGAAMGPSGQPPGASRGKPGGSKGALRRPGQNRPMGASSQQVWSQGQTPEEASINRGGPMTGTPGAPSG